MGRMVEAEVNGERRAEGSDAGKISASDPVVYQLVRVEGDGRLVPATDDEVMEVEHLLEDDKSFLSSAEDMRLTEGCLSSEVLLSKKSDVEGSEGPLQSENMEVDSRQLNARLEYIKVMLQKVKQEERLRLMCESHDHHTEYVVVDSQSSDHPERSQALDDKLQHRKTSSESAPELTCFSGSHGAQLENTGTCSEPANEAVSRSSVSETCTDSKPDFSILKGEICLDNLTIRELQQYFRATFGRHTSVKDKLWLKRRIAMGLMNSCDVPTTNFIIKDNRIVQKDVKEEVNHEVTGNMCAPDFLSADQASGLISESWRGSPNSRTNQIEDHQIFSGKRLKKSQMEFDTKNDDFQGEQCTAKRTRKPTKRYIEELSEGETRECTGKLVSSARNSAQSQSSPKSQIRPFCDIPSRGTFVTRKDSLGGSGVQIPYVSRVRRRQPRKNLVAFMNFAPTERENRVSETSSSEDQDFSHETDTDTGFLKHETKKIVPAGDVSDGNVDSVPTLKDGGKRKHHRAWTLCEVMKLVDGVARYGAGRWSEIRRLAFASYSYRTSVDLKDKWRNLLRASFAQDPADNGARNSRKHTSTPIPTQILLRVRELAEVHSHAGIEFRAARFVGPGSKIVQEKGTGFL